MPTADSADTRRWLQWARARCSLSALGSTQWQLFFAAVVAALTIAPQSSVDAGVGIDPSWEAVVALAAERYIPWGSELVFTYGPLGYLQTTAYYSLGQSVLATIYQFLVVGALFLGITTALHVCYAPIPAIIRAFVTTGIVAIIELGHGTSLGMMYPELAVLAVLAWAAVLMLRQDPPPSLVFVSCLVFGAVGGLQLVVKFNTGLIILLIALVTSVLFCWRDLVRHCATGAAFMASGLFWWLIAGQRLGNVPSWFKSSMDVLTGYHDAQAIPLMKTDLPAVLLSLAWFGLLCGMVMRNSPSTPRRLVVLVGVTSVVTAKSAFGRFDIWHFSMLLGLIVVAVAIFPSFGIRQNALAVIAVLVVFVSMAQPPMVLDCVVAAVHGPGQAVERLFTLAMPGHVEQRAERTKLRQRAHHGVPRRFIDVIGSKTVHVDPDETSVVWAYNLKWHPTPVFATYSAYTPSLDKLNSDSLAAGPEYVLSRVSDSSPAKGIDGRLATQESPLYSRALLCNFALIGIENHWALFARTRPHCGPLTPLSEVDIGKNNPVSVPAPSGSDMAILVGIDLDPTPVDRLSQGAVVPLNTFTVVVDTISYRLIKQNAGEPFLIGSPESVDGSNLEIHAQAIGIGRLRVLGQDGVHARLRFYEMAVRSDL